MKYIQYTKDFDNRIDFKRGIPHPVFIRKLQKARDHYGKPIKISSGGRSRKRNISIGGAKTSAHIIKEDGYFWGCDIKCTNSKDRYKLEASLKKAGFNRIGLYDKHVHVDCAPWLPPEVLWPGKSK